MTKLGKVRIKGDVGTFSGSYNDLTDKPTFGSAASQDVNAFAPALGTDDNYVTDEEKANLHAPHSDDQTIEGTAVLSTGETGGTKFLREDGDGTCSWQTPAGGHTQNTDTGTTNNTFTIDSDSSLGKIIIQVVTAAANKTLTLKNSALTNDVVLTFPNVTGTLARQEDLANYFANDLTILDGKTTPVATDVIILGDSEDGYLPKQIAVGDDRDGFIAYLKSIFDTIYQPL